MEIKKTLQRIPKILIKNITLIYSQQFVTYYLQIRFV